MKETDFYSLSLEEQEKYIRKETLPGRKEHLQTLQRIRGTLSSQLEELERLVSGTLLFETEEEVSLRRGIASLKSSLSKLDSTLSLLGEGIRRVEEENL